MSPDFDPREIPPQEYKDRIRALEARLTIEKQACERTEAELAWWNRGMELFAPTAGKPAVGQFSLIIGDNPVAPSANGGTPTLRDNLLQIMREGVSQDKLHWKAPELIRVLAHRGLMPNGKNAEHIVRSKLSALTKAGELARTSYGTYALPSAIGERTEAMR